MTYIGNIPEDFNPNESYKRKEDSNSSNDEWDFEARESFESDLEHKSRVTLNLTKQHPK